VFAVLIAAAGYWAWRQQAQAMQRQAERSLAAVGKLKADQITTWLNERHGNAEMIRANPLISVAVSDLLAGRNSAQASADLQAVLDAFRRTYGYREVVMTSPKGVVLLRSPQAASTPLGARTNVLVRKAATTGRIESSDLYTDTAGEPRIDFVAPILNADGGTPAVAAVTLRTDPGTFLYPLIQSWPLPSSSGETLLVERRGNRIVYLNDLRFRDNAALVFTTPVDTPQRPAAMAVRGRHGVVQGLDYRGVPVLAAIQPVPQTPWFIVAKEDTSDVLGPIRTRGWLTAVVAFALVALAGAGTLLLWRARESQASVEIRESEEKFRGFFELTADLVVIADVEGNFREVNSAWSKTLGYSKEELLGKPFLAFVHPDDVEMTKQVIAEHLQRGETVVSFENRYIGKDGGSVWLGWTAQPEVAEGYTFAIARDITERKHAEAALRDSEAALRAILDATPFPVALVDARDDVIDYWSSSALTLFGHTAPTAAEWYEMAYPDPDYRREVIDRWEPLLERARRSGQAVNTGEYRIACRDGSVRICELHVIFLADRLVVTFNDITERKQAEEELRETRDYLENLFGYANAPVIVWDQELRITRFNHAFEELTQRAVAEVVGRHLDLLFPDDERRTQALGHVTSASAGERWQVVEIPILRADGEVRTVLWNSATVYAADKMTPVATIAQGHDITERVQAEDELRASERKFRETILALDEGYYSVTLDAVLLDHNPAFNRILGIDPDADLRGTRGPGFWWDPADRTVYVEHLSRDGVIHDHVVRAKAADGSPLILLVSAHLVRDEHGEIKHIDGSIVDFTVRKAAEDEIERLNAELEQRVLERTAQLDATNKELEAFAYSVSHDLRAPLRHISGFSELLAARSAGVLDDRGRHYLETITTSVGQMGVLIDDLLQFSRTGRAALQIAEVDMEAALREALEPLQRETEGRDVEWSIGPLPAVIGDRALLRQVWANLLGNAVKYTRGRAPARIEVGARDGDGDGASEDVFWVRDNGVGFDMQYAHKLFGVFQRLHSSAEFEGTGIGLANVQRIIDRLGGRVWAEAELDQGAVFYFSLPRRKETPS